MKVLIVDDSVTFRAAIKAALAGEADIEAPAVAANGKIALAKIASEAFDVVILDLEMPEMDGLDTLKAMQKLDRRPQVLIFSSSSETSYLKVSQALAIGASDFLAKPTGTDMAGSIEGAIAPIKAELLPKLRLLTTKLNPAQGPQAEQLSVRRSEASPSPSQFGSKRNLSLFQPTAVVIASSTGGPMALESVFSGLKGPLRVPIFIVQHMPPPFTKGLADRLQELTGIAADEAHDNETVVANRIYVAPADFHMSLVAGAGAPKIKISSGERINFVRPAADPLFTSAAQIYRTNLMAFVLTGMGEDGKVGACDVKKAGGGVMVQDVATSVVWGMPGAVVAAGAFDEIASLTDCGATLRRMVVA